METISLLAAIVNFVFVLHNSKPIACCFFALKAPEFLCKLNGPNNGAGNFKLNVRIIGLESSTRKGSRKLNIFNYTGQQNFGLEDPF